MKTYPTQDLPHGRKIDIRGVPGASFQHAAHAILTDMLRRLKAGELTSLKIRAEDRNDNLLKAKA